MTPEAANKFAKNYPKIDISLCTWDNLVAQLEKAYFSGHLYEFIHSGLVQKECSDPKVLYDYALFLIGLCLEYPNIAHQNIHHISEIKAILNDLEDNDRDIPDQTLAQLNYHISRNSTNSKNINFRNLDMIAQDLGSGFKIKPLEVADNEHLPSPHPGYFPARLSYGGENTNSKKNTNIYALKELDKIPWIKIRSESEGQSIQVKPIGVSNDFTFVYYQTEHNQLVRICLYMQKTKELFEEWVQHIGEDRDKYNYIGDPKLFQISLLENPAQIISWLDSQGVELGSISQDLKPAQLKTILKSKESQIKEKIGEKLKEAQTEEENTELADNNQASEDKEEIIEKDTEEKIEEKYYNALIWKTNQLMLRSPSLVSQIDSWLGLLSDKNRSIYYKVCECLKNQRIVGGSSINDSHLAVFRYAVDHLNGTSLEEVKDQKPSLVLILDENDSNIHYPLTAPADSDLSDVSFVGSELASLNSELYNSIKLEFKVGNSIVINGIPVQSLAEFDKQRILLGANIRFVNSSYV